MTDALIIEKEEIMTHQGRTLHKDRSIYWNYEAQTKNAKGFWWPPKIRREVWKGFFLRASIGYQH